VFSGLQAQKGILSLRIIIQSSDRPADYLERCVAFVFFEYAQPS
jgi:hypothetical protein